MPRTCTSNACFFLFFLLVFTYAACHIMEWTSIVRFHFEILIFYIYFLINILWIDAIVSFHDIILTALLKITCFLLISTPILISVQRRERIFSLIIEVLKSKIFPARLDAKMDSKQELVNIINNARLSTFENNHYRLKLLLLTGITFCIELQEKEFKCVLIMVN